MHPGKVPRSFQELKAACEMMLILGNLKWPTDQSGAYGGEVIGEVLLFFFNKNIFIVGLKTITILLHPVNGFGVFLIGIQLLYSAMLISGAQKCDSAMCTQMSPSRSSLPAPIPPF